MRNILLLCSLVCLAPIVSVAQPVDGSARTNRYTQTVHHCGLLPVTSSNYTRSSITTGIVETNLKSLGYCSVRANKVYDADDAEAVRAFQADNGLPVNGVVSGATAQRLAYLSHPSAHVRNCFRVSKKGLR